MVTLKDKVKDVEKEEIVSALKECNGVSARAARRLGSLRLQLIMKGQKGEGRLWDSLRLK